LTDFWQNWPQVENNNPKNGLKRYFLLKLLILLKLTAQMPIQPPLPWGQTRACKSRQQVQEQISNIKFFVFSTIFS